MPARTAMRERHASQSIDSALEKTSARTAFRRQRSDAALDRAEARSTGCAPATPTAACRCCGLPETRDDLATIRDTASGCATAPATSCFSAPAGRASAARRWRSLPAMRVPGVGALRDAAAPALHGQSRSGQLTARCSRRLPLRTTRFVAISKSGGTGETLMQTIAALAAVKAAGLDPRSPISSSASPSRPRPASERPARPARRSITCRCWITTPASAAASRC